ncbi:heparan sulfate glucosamine 3-O-sulfotransferase 6-like [Apostichopus japonicus]|uniref:heparan sulfate glucosamine 3-O-sulfotransferase 6-like n=1 Tax=Stichopus japonicus TaxID=307972 RepID=UPI003AB1EA8C
MVSYLTTMTRSCHSKCINFKRRGLHVIIAICILSICTQIVIRDFFEISFKIGLISSSTRGEISLLAQKNRDPFDAEERMNTLHNTTERTTYIRSEAVFKKIGNIVRPFSNMSGNLDYNKTEKRWGCYDYRNNRLGASRSPADSVTQRKLDCKKRAPDVILLGVKKCGSQTLTGFLDLHPELVSEVYPFSSNKVKALVDGDSAAFLKPMPLSTSSELTLLDIIEIQDNQQVLGELLKMAKKFLLILVSPVLRAHSDYAHVRTKMKLPENIENLKHMKLPVWDGNLRGKREPNIFYKGYRIADSFEKSVLDSLGNIDKTNQLIRKGLYLEYVNNILHHISRENLMVIDGELFSSEPWTVLGRVEKFLGISHFFTQEMFRKRGSFFCPVIKERPDSDCLKGKGRKKKAVDSKVKRKLQYFYH